MANNNNNWKRIGGFSRTGTQNYVRTNDAAMGGTIFGSTDVSNNVGNTTLRIGNNAGVVYINGDIDMSGGVNVGAPINRIRNVRDPIADQDVATKFYVDERVDAIVMGSSERGPTGPEGPPGIGIGGQNGSDGPMGHTGPTGPLGATGSSFGVKGPTGERGGTGSTGANGAAGATGPIGPNGEKGEQGIQGTQGIQGSNGTILWLNPDGDSPTNQLITDSYLLSKVPINASIRTVGPISVSATYGNVNKIIPASRFYNTAIEISTLAVIPSGVWVVNLYANVPSNSDANQVALYAAVFMISGTTNQPSPDSLIIETKDGGDAGYYPPRAAYLPDHVKYIGKSWGSTENVLTSNTDTANKGVTIDGTSRKLYKLEMPVEFITLKDASGNRENVYVQLQIYVRNTKEANQTANVSLYFQTDATTNETTYSYLQTTFGAVGINGIPGSTGSTGAKGEIGLIGPAGPAGATGSAGPTGIAGPVGPRGSQGPTGVTGPEGSSNSYGVQYAVQYRGNQSTGDTDNSGNFRGDTNFRYIPTGYLNRLTDATAGSIVLNDLACNSIHSPVYVQDTSIVVGSGTTRPRTYIRGGELVNSGGSAEQSNYVVLASGTDTTNGNNSKTAVSVNDITNGIKMIHNYGTKKVTFQVHDENKASGTVGLQFDLNGSAVLGNVSAAQDQFCIVNSSGAAGVGGITAAQLSSSTYTTLNRMLHVRGNVMVGSDPGGVNAASNAMVLLNKSTTTPSGLLSGYPGVYHRQIASGDVPALGGATNSIATGGEGLGFISPNFITFQTGSSLSSNSIVINQAGVVSVTGRTNLNGAVTVNKNFGTVETHASLAPVMDISGTLSVSTGAPDFTDVPRIKLISRGIAADSAIPSATTTASSNEIRGVSSNASTSGFLRLSAQTPAHSCIDLIGLNTSASAYNNAVRINTGGTERMIVNGSGNVGIGTNAPSAPLDVVGNTILRNSVRIGSTTAPSVALDVTGAARLTASSATATALTTTGRIGVNQPSPTVPLDVVGAAKIAGELNMNSNKIVNLTTPTAEADAANKSYVDTATTNMATTSSVSTAITTALGSSGTQTNNPTVADAANGNANYRILFTTATSGRATLNHAAQLTYNASTNTLTTGSFSGNLSGNATSATNGINNGIFQVGYYSFYNTTSSLSNMNKVALHVYPLSNAISARPWRGRTSGVVFGSTVYSWLNSSNDTSAIDSITLSSGTYYLRDFTSFEYAQPLSSSNNYPQLFNSRNCVAFFYGFLQADFIVAGSDERIKKNIKHIQDDDALLTLRKLKVSRFEYIDKVKNTPYNVYGFVAQDIKGILPETTEIVKDYIPNFYFFCDVKTIEPTDSEYLLFEVSILKESKNTFVFTGNHDNSGNEYITTNGNPASDADGNQHFKVRFYDINFNTLDFETTRINDEKSFVIKISKSQYETLQFEEGVYFIYGQEVDDFHKIDKDHIYNVTTAALQEVDRQQQADKARIAELENQVSNLEATVASQQSLINDILERLKSNGM